MPDLSFRVTGVDSPPHSAAPLLHFKLAVRECRPAKRRSRPSCCAARSASSPPRGSTTTPKSASLLDLFGEPERWAQTLRSMLWTHSSVVVPPFRGDI